MVWSVDGGAPKTRVTDEVGFFCKRGELPAAVNMVQQRDPDFHRWRRAFSSVARVSCAWLQGRALLRTESALREVIDALPDPRLAKELILDAREAGIGMDLGDPLPVWTAHGLMRLAGEHGIDLVLLARIAPLPVQGTEPLDTAGVVLAARDMSRRHRQRAQALFLELPEDDEHAWSPQQRTLGAVVHRCVVAGDRWDRFALALVG
jgi:hypothetical protein